MNNDLQKWKALSIDACTTTSIQTHADAQAYITSYIFVGLLLPSQLPIGIIGVLTMKKDYTSLSSGKCNVGCLIAWETTTARTTISVSFFIFYE